jgi:hypothetical protein
MRPATCRNVAASLAATFRRRGEVLKGVEQRGQAGVDAERAGLPDGVLDAFQRALAGEQGAPRGVALAELGVEALVAGLGDGAGLDARPDLHRADPVPLRRRRVRVGDLVLDALAGIAGRVGVGDVVRRGVHARLGGAEGAQSGLDAVERVGHGGGIS